MTETKVTRLSLLEAIEDQMSAPTATYSVYLNGEAWSRGKALRDEIRAAKLAADGLVSDAPKLQAQLDQVQAEIKESELVFTFAAIPRTRYAELVDLHQSTDPALAWNSDTFPPALVQAACTRISGVAESDGLTLEEVAALYEKLNQSQTDELFRAAFTLQIETPKPFLVPAGAATTNGGPSSNTATTTESPTANS